MTPSDGADSSCSGCEARNASGAEAFEGREKRLDIRFVRVEGDGRRQHKHDDDEDVGGLRSLSDAALQRLSGCTVALARRDADESEKERKTRERKNGVHAFILSESSLFVSARRWVVKTCGQARMLRPLADLLRHAEASGLRPVRLTYSRGAYLFPERQQPPHHPEFEREVAHVRQCLQKASESPRSPPVAELSSSSDAAIAKLSRQSRSCSHDETPPHGWSVYEWRTAEEQTPANDDDDDDQEEEDHDVEVCASGVSAESSEMFTARTGFAGRGAVKTFVTIEVARALAAASDSAEADDVSVTSLDDLCFGTCGYSLNAVLVVRRRRPSGSPHPEIAYVTVHVTPEPHWLRASYVSVEASLAGRRAHRNTNRMARVAAAIPAFVCRVFEPRGVACMARTSSKQETASDFVPLPHPPPDYRVTSTLSLVPRLRWWEAVVRLPFDERPAQ